MEIIVGKNDIRKRISLLYKNEWNSSKEYYVFFFKQKTAYEMCGRDWSSDVCSSDLSSTVSVSSISSTVSVSSISSTVSVSSVTTNVSVGSVSSIKPKPKLKYVGMCVEFLIVIYCKT